MSEYLFPFEKLDVWQLAIDLAEYVLNLLQELNQNKHNIDFRLKPQAKRSFNL